MLQVPVLLEFGVGVSAHSLSLSRPLPLSPSYHSLPSDLRVVVAPLMLLMLLKRSHLPYPADKWAMHLEDYLMMQKVVHQDEERYRSEL